MQRTLRIIYASTSGHTEFVVDTLAKYLKERDPQMVTTLIRAERAMPEDLTKDDLTILASSTWNTGSIEGQLNPHMHAFLMTRAKDMDLRNGAFAVIALGDYRYFYTAKASDHLSAFIEHHDGKQVLPSLSIINEPFDQTERIEHFGDELITIMKTLTTKAEG